MPDAPLERAVEALEETKAAAAQAHQSADEASHALKEAGGGTTSAGDHDGVAGIDLSGGDGNSKGGTTGD